MKQGSAGLADRRNSSRLTCRLAAAPQDSLPGHFSVLISHPLGEVENAVGKATVWDQKICKLESLARTSLLKKEKGSPRRIMDYYKRNPGL